MEKIYSERKGKLSELDRSFDLKFWQAQSATARFQVTWELIQHAWKVKGNDVRQLRLQRSIESYQKQHLADLLSQPPNSEE
jgi:hypothetical protein